MNKEKLLARTLLGLVVLVCCTFLFWFQGGIRWLERDIFPPRRPSFMPSNAIWIDAPPLPISWHHGWWFGCNLSPSGATDYCRLVNEGRTVYGGDYVSCRTRGPVPEQALQLIAPPHGSQDMWLFGENAEGVAGFTKDGDILLPLTAIAKCNAVRAKQTATHLPGGYRFATTALFKK
jgi:hypothetical protein